MPTEPGGQCVASLPGGSEKLMLSVGNLDTVCLVRINRRRAIRPPYKLLFASYIKCVYSLIYAPCLSRYSVTTVSLLACIDTLIVMKMASPV